MNKSTVTLYRNGHSIASLARCNNVSDRTVQRFLIKHGAWKQGKLPTVRRKSKYIYDETFFEKIDCETKAYWLGFLAADGNITIDKHNRYYVRLHLQSKDASHLDKFREALSANYPVIVKHTARLTLCGKYIADTLIRLGIVPRKTRILKWPNIPRNLARHFCRGYFDGDGCWYIDKKQNAMFTVTSNKHFIKDFQNNLIESCGLRTTKIVHRGNSASIYYGGNKQCRRIFNYMYSDATVFMDRKKSRVSGLLSSPE